MYLSADSSEWVNIIVAVNPAEIKVSYNGSDKKWHATINATAEQLKSAPEFKYNGRWSASKS